MANYVDRKLGSLTVHIDRDACIGSGNCTKVAPEVFALDPARVATFAEGIPDPVDPQRVVDACDVCPVGALIIRDAGGRQIVPRP